MSQEDEYTYEDKLRREILFYLYKEACWGVHHCKIEELLHRIRVDSESPSKNAIKKQIRQLLNELLISRYKKLKNVYLNSSKKNEIEAEIQDLIDDHFNI
ncbi:hypothetical protein [Methanobacterium formicicum]|uniref:hypothetical protein n=1 Tax=Methanobacterium formicicum TaxID=2162 RepID=UPI002492E459|nr:hypothetical protein [Methanobacterium formicicum]